MKIVKLKKLNGIESEMRRLTNGTSMMDHKSKTMIWVVDDSKTIWIVDDWNNALKCHECIRYEQEGEGLYHDTGRVLLPTEYVNEFLVGDGDKTEPCSNASESGK